MKMINNILELAMELIKIKSVSANQAEVHKAFDLIAEFLTEKKDIYMERENFGGSPSALFSYEKTYDFDYLFMGHIDVVPAEDKMFNPVIDGDKLYGRGAYDMKGMASVMINVFKSLNPRNDKKVGLLLVGDEEIGGNNGTQRWVKEKGLKSRVVLDLDAASPINFIFNRAKAPYFIEFTAKGKEVHGAYPWLGYDANEELLETLHNLRKHFVYYHEKNIPEDEWVNTMHIGMISGGKGANIVSSSAKATVDIRLNDTLTEDELTEILNKSLAPNVTYSILSKGTLVKTNENNETLQKYKNIVEKITEKNVSFKGMNGATDGRYFASENTVIITHQSDGYGPHQEGEWVSIKGLYEMEKILKTFLNS